MPGSEGSGGLRSVILSGWSFYFRWPKAHVEPFRPAGIYLGPLYQAGVAGAAGFLAIGLVSIVVPLLDLAPARVGSLETHVLFTASLALAVITGLFHEDGWADTADSLGVPSYGRSASRRPRILEAMRDPRLGTYGATALILLWLLRYYGLAAWVTHTPPVGTPVTAGSLIPAVILYATVIFWSRWAGLASASLLLPRPFAPKIEGAYAPGTERPTSSHNIAEMSGATRALWVLGTAAVGCGALWAARQLIVRNHGGHATGVGGAVGTIGPWLLPVILGWALAVALQWGTSRRTGVLGGDIIGASICATELFFIVYILSLI